MKTSSQVRSSGSVTLCLSSGGSAAGGEGCWEEGRTLVGLPFCRRRKKEEVLVKHIWQKTNTFVNLFVMVIFPWLLVQFLWCCQKDKSFISSFLSLSRSTFYLLTRASCLSKLSKEGITELTRYRYKHNCFYQKHERYIKLTVTVANQQWSLYDQTSCRHNYIPCLADHFRNSCLHNYHYNCYWMLNYLTYNHNICTTSRECTIKEVSLHLEC